MKKIISILLVFAMLTVLLMTSVGCTDTSGGDTDASASTHMHAYSAEGKCRVCGVEMIPTEGLSYVISEERGECIVTGAVVQLNGDVTIPLEYRGYKVIGIGKQAFADMANVTGVSIPEGVYYIAESAFRLCKSLSRVSLPDTLSLMDGDVFYGCNALQYTERDGIKYLGNAANPYVLLMEASEPISGSFTVGDETHAIYQESFKGYTALTEVKLPRELVFIGDSAFEGCKALSSIELGESLQVISSRAFYGCEALETVELPNTLTDLYDEVFGNCVRLSALHLPASLDVIGIKLLGGCSSLTSLTVAEGNEAFYSENSCVIKREGNIVVLGCNGSTLPTDKGITKIEAYAFYGSEKLTEIVLPDTVKELGEEAFSGCSALASIAMTGVESIGKNAFSGCTSITELTFSEGLKRIGEKAFNHCEKLGELSVPSTLEKIDSFALMYCLSIGKIYYNGSTEAWANIERASSWSSTSGEFTVYCTDGEITKGNA